MRSGGRAGVWGPPAALSSTRSRSRRQRRCDRVSLLDIRRSTSPGAGCGHASTDSGSKCEGASTASTVSLCIAVHRTGTGDVELSGARADRPGLAQALDYVRDGDVLVVWKLDRLGRSLSHLIETVAGLQKKGVSGKSPRQARRIGNPLVRARSSPRLERQVHPLGRSRGLEPRGADGKLSSYQREFLECSCKPDTQSTFVS